MKNLFVLLLLVAGSVAAAPDQSDTARLKKLAARIQGVGSPIEKTERTDIPDGFLDVLRKVSPASEPDLLQLIDRPEYRNLWDQAFFVLGVLEMAGRSKVPVRELLARVEAVEQREIPGRQKTDILYSGYYAAGRRGAEFLPTNLTNRNE